MRRLCPWSCDTVLRLEEAIEEEAERPVPLFRLCPTAY